MAQSKKAISALMFIKEMMGENNHDPAIFPKRQAQTITGKVTPPVILA